MTDDRVDREQRRSQFAESIVVSLGEIAGMADEIIQRLFAQRIIYSPTNGAHVMVLSFATKQREHLRSVRLLVDANAHRDAYLIARTMVEGLGRLLWSYNGRPDRTDL